MKLWSKLLIIRKNNEHLKDIMLLLELCLCTTFSNTTLERFSHLKVVTTKFRSKLSARSLNSIMRKRIKGVSLEEFNQDYTSKCADFLYNSRARRLNQSKRKEYAERKSTKEKEYNSISMNLQVKVAHVLAKKSVLQTLLLRFLRLQFLGILWTFFIGEFL